MRAAFAQFDTDSDGGLTAREVRTALRKLGLPDATADDAIATLHKYDGDGDGKLDLPEFGKLVQELTRYQLEEAARREELLVPPEVRSPPHLPPHCARARARRHCRPASLPLRPQVRAAFEVFDTDKSGAIKARELTAALGKLGVSGGTAEALTLLKKYDADGDGALRLNEFARMVADLLEEQALRKPPPPEVRRPRPSSGALRAPPFPQDAPCSHPSSLGVVQVLHAFQLFDKDRDGRLRALEVRGALTQLGLPATAAEAEGIMRDFDKDRDGGLDPREFHKLVLRVKAFQRRPAAAAAATAVAAAGDRASLGRAPAAAAATAKAPSLLVQQHGPPSRVDHLTSVQLQGVLRARGVPPPAGASQSALAQLCRERGVHEVTQAELARLAPPGRAAARATAPPRADAYVPLSASRAAPPTR